MTCRSIAGGVELDVRVKPGARRSELVGLHGNRLKLAVAAPAEDGKANRELVKLLARLFGLRQEAVQLLRGQSSRDKTLRLEGIEPQAVRDLVAERAPGAS